VPTDDFIQWTRRSETEPGLPAATPHLAYSQAANCQTSPGID
jgi:hypothetical protein